MDDKERGDVLQVEQFNDARATLHQQVVALAGCGTMKVDVAGTMWKRMSSPMTARSSIVLLQKAAQRNPRQTQKSGAANEFEPMVAAEP